MKPDDPMLADTVAIELWRHDDPEPSGCHVGLYFRSDGVHELLEMRMEDNIIPLHPGFPMGYAMAAHVLMHIAKELYAGTLVQKDVPAVRESLLDGWNYDEESHHGDDLQEEDR